MSSAVAKSGWLYRQSAILRRWKKSWFVLYQDGSLRYYEHEQTTSAQDSVLLSSQCVAVLVGQNVPGVEAPNSLHSAFLIQLRLRSGTHWNLCGENIDDSKAWELAFEQARVFIPLSRHASQPSLINGVDIPRYYSDDGALRYPMYNDGNTFVRAYGGSTYVPAYTQGYVYIPQPGGTTVIVPNRPYYRRYHRTAGTNMALGVLGGAAIGSLLFSPFYWGC